MKLAQPRIQALKNSRMWIMSQIAGANDMNPHLMIETRLPIVCYRPSYVRRFATWRSGMMESDGMLRHLAFFEELAKLDESDPGWRSVSAGLVTMRLVDSWLTGERSAPDSWAINAVRGAIDEVPETTPLRRILAAIVDTMTASSFTESHTLCPRLIAYGQGLEYDAKWSPVWPMRSLD